MVEEKFLAAENSEICGSKSYFTTMGKDGVISRRENVMSPSAKLR